MLSNGFILTGLLWGSMLAFLIDHRAKLAALCAFVCAVLTLFGVNRDLIKKFIFIERRQGVTKSYQDKVVSAKTAISSIARGKRVFIGSYCGEPQHLVNALIDHTDHFSDVEVVRFLNLEGSLKGQVAADGSAQNHFADVAGLVDFSRGAAMAPGGKSIVVVPSTSEDGRTSNIVLEQAAGTVAIPAADVTYVVTEYGAVNLFGKNVQERAMAMISVAHPDFRESLFEQARREGYIGQDRKLYESQFGVYPAWLEEVLTIAGQKVTLRPVKTVDDRLIQEHFYEMEEKDVAKRFFGRKHHFYCKEAPSGNMEHLFFMPPTFVLLMRIHRPDHKVCYFFP